MDLITACKSGKKFQRPHWRDWVMPVFNDSTDLIWLDSRNKVSFAQRDLLANDYIVEEKTVSLSESRFNEAFRTAQERIDCAFSYSSFVDVLKEELFK